METPIYDFLKEYAGKKTVRAHMPGHKGRSPVPELEKMYTLDITEITGADSLFEAEGIIKQSEENARRLFDTEETVYSCGGSTLSIQAMLFLMKQENRRVIAGRNVHRAFLNACILLGLHVTWVYPDEEKGILSGGYRPEDFEKALSEAKEEPCCVYVTSPDYMGNMADIKALSAVCRRFGAPLLVDNAHGAHLAFFKNNLHPMALGADLCCDSAHKTLPCLTGCGYLHTSNERYKGRLKGAMSMFGSTSPSYLMLASLDLCNVFLENEAAENLEAISQRVNEMKRRLSGRYIFAGGMELLHIVTDTAAMKTDGRYLAKKLEEKGCFPEYAGCEAVILLLSAWERQEVIERMEKILTEMEEMPFREWRNPPPSFPKPEAVMDIREAALSASENISAHKAEGRICAGVRVPCPPAVPIVISGERIDKETADVLRFYGIDRVEVVAE